LSGIVEWNDAAAWASGLREPMRRMTNPVAVTYGIASLAAILCPVDKPLGADLFREAVSDLNNTPDDMFRDSGKVLPVATFSGLWKLVMGPGAKCDATLPQPSDHAREKREAERRQAASFLAQAKFTDDYDRAAQLAQAALEAGDPSQLDIASITGFLIEFRVPAPELADDVFERAIAFATEAEIPNIGALADLGNYLFLAPAFVGKSEPVLNRTTYSVNGSTFSNWQGDHDNVNPDMVTAYIGAVADLLSNNAIAASFDPVAAYATAFQLLPKAQDLALGDADTLQKVLQQMQAQYSSAAAAVEARLGAEPPAVPNQSNFARSMARIRAALAAGRFAEARDLLTEVDGVPTRSQIAALIDFSEAAHAMRGKDSDHAMDLAGKLPGGVKRSLLYAGIVATAANRLTAIMALHLGLKDAELLSYEQRMALLPAFAAACMAVDRDETQGVLNQLIASSNDASTTPRKSRFDPKDTRAFDGARVLFGPGGFQETVQSARGRQNFSLKVTGVSAFSLESFIAQAKSMDFMQLEATVEGLRNELQLTKAYLALARLRLKMAKSVSTKPALQ
jgi:hypothetical protein